MGRVYSGNESAVSGIVSGDDIRIPYIAAVFHKLYYIWQECDHFPAILF